MIVLDKFRGGRELVPGRELVHHHQALSLTVTMKYKPDNIGNRLLIQSHKPTEF